MEELSSYVWDDQKARERFGAMQDDEVVLLAQPLCAERVG